MKLANPRILYSLSACFAAALAGVGFVYLGTPGALSFALTAIIASFLTLHLAWQHREHIEALNKHAETSAMAGLTLFLPAVLLWGLLPGLLILLSFAQLALNLQLAEHKHVHYGLLVSFICLFLGAAEAITGYYLVFIALYAIAASLCLSDLNADRPGADHTAFDPRSSMALLAWLFGLTVIVYLVMPRPPAANLGGQYSVAARFYEASEWDTTAADGGAGNAGDHDSAAYGERTGQLSSRQLSSQEQGGYDYQGFRESFSILDSGPDTATGNALLALMSAAHGAYLKVESFDRFDGLEWHKSRPYQRRRALDKLTLELDPAGKPNFQQTIRLVSSLGPYIPAAPVAVKLHFPAESVARDAYHNLKLPAKLQKGVVYTVESMIRYDQQRPFAGTAAPPQAADLALYDGFDERIAGLAGRVTKNASDDISKALLLETFLRQNYRYDPDSIIKSQQHTPLDRFLFETGAGHCEFFASALAVMLRSQGIPSRLITGFSATTLNPLTGYYEIYSLDGHAWVEAWIEGKGWMLLEPTPPYELPRNTTETVTASLMQQYVEALSKYTTLANEDTPGLAGIWSFIAEQFRTLMQVLRERIAPYTPLVLLTAVVMICCWLLYRHFGNDILAWRLYWRVKRYRHGNTPEAVIFYMQHIHKLLLVRDQPRLPGDSIEAFCRHPALRGLDRASLRSMADQINRRFYKDTRTDLDGALLKRVFFHVYDYTKTQEHQV